MNRRLITVLIGAVLLVGAILIASFVRWNRVVPEAKGRSTENYIDSARSVEKGAKTREADPADAKNLTTTRESVELASLKSALMESLEDERHRKFLEALSRMRASDAPAVAELLLQFKKLGRKLPVESAAFWRRWGELDSKAALAMLMTEPFQSGQGNAEMIQWIFQGLAVKSPDAAIEWLNSHGKDPNFEPAFLGFLDRYSVTDLNGATKLTLASLSADDPLLGRALNRLCNRVYEQSSAVGLKQWFSQLPSDERSRPAKEQVANRVYQLLVAQDVNSAMDWLRSESDTAGRSRFVMQDLCVRYGRIDPPAAMDLMASMPGTEDSRWPGVGRVIKEWIRTDAAAFESWMEDHKSTPVFQHVAHDYAQIIAATDKEKARGLADQITDPQMHDNVMRRVNGEPPPNWVVRDTSPEEIAQRFGFGGSE